MYEILYLIRINFIWFIQSLKRDLIKQEKNYSEVGSFILNFMDGSREKSIIFYDNGRARKVRINFKLSDFKRSLFNLKIYLSGLTLWRRYEMYEWSYEELSDFMLK